jgi:putative MATE family efflux protein
MAALSGAPGVTPRVLRRWFIRASCWPRGTGERKEGSMGQRPSTAAPPRTHGRDLTTGSIPRHMVAFSLPMLAGSALQTAYSFVNAIWVGQFLGKSALAAVTVSFPVIFVLIALGAGLTMATNILVAQYFGARDMLRMRSVVNNSIVLIGLLSLGLLAVGEVFTPHILRAMDTPPEVLPLATHYMRIFLLSLPFGFGLFLTRAMLQGIGDSATPIYFQSSSVLLTAILDPLLMFGWLGFPRLGLNGTAWAATVSQAGAVVALLLHLHRRNNPVAPAWRGVRLDWATTWTTIRIGVPSAMQQSLVSIGMVFVIGIVNQFGENATAAFGVASRVDQLAFMPAMTFSMAISTVAGQNIGAGRHHRVKEAFWWGLVLAGSITLVASLLATTAPGLLLRIFTSDASVIRLGVTYLRVVGFCYVLFAVMFVSNGIINGAGHTFITTVISFVSQWAVRVPMAYFLAHRLGSVTGIWYAIAASFGVSMLCSLGYYSSGRWKRAVVRHRPAPVTEVALFGEEVGEV